MNSFDNFRAALAAGLFVLLANGSSAVTVETVSQINGEQRIVFVPITDSKLRTLLDLQRDLDEYFFFYSDPILPLGESVDTRLNRLVDSDPWMFLNYEIQNNTSSEIFYSLIMRMQTDVTSGPTQKDAFLTMELIDSNNDGFVQSRNTSARFEVTDDPLNGNPLNDIQGLGFSPGGGFQLYQGEGVHSVFDETGAGPNSDNVAGTNGYNTLSFFLNGQLSAGDSLIVNGLGCYASSLSLCPERQVLAALNFNPQPDGDGTNVVPLPASVLMLGAALASLLGMRARRRAA